MTYHIYSGGIYHEQFECCLPDVCNLSPVLDRGLIVKSWYGVTNSVQ